MYFSGITEAYDYQTPEGWWVIYVTFPDEIFRVWLEDFPYDCCVSEVSDKIKYDWDFTILIKDPVAYLHFTSNLGGRLITNIRFVEASMTRYRLILCSSNLCLIPGTGQIIGIPRYTSRSET